MRSDTPEINLPWGPHDARKRASTLCSRGPEQPLVLSGICLNLAREVFSSAVQIDEAKLGGIIYDPDETKTKIRMGMTYTFNAQNIQQLPAIYVKRGPVSRRRISIGDSYISGGQAERGLQLGRDSSVDNFESFAVLLLSGYTWFCVGKSGEMAESIAAELWLRLVEWAPKIREDLGLTRFEVMDMGEVQQLEEADTHWVVPVSAAIAHQYKWQMRPIGPKLKAADVNVI